MSSKSAAKKASRKDVAAAVASSTELSTQTRQEIEEALALFDSSTSGDTDKVDVKDLKVIMRALGFEPRKEDIAAMAAQLQPDEQGEVLRSAVVAVVGAKMADKDSQAEIVRAFRLFDDEDTGVITLANLRRVAKELGETSVTDDELRAMIAEADTSATGAVSQTDFVAIMKNTCLY